MPTTLVGEAISTVCDILTYEVIKKWKPRKKRKVWIREWVQRRETLGASSALYRELREEDELDHTNFYRLNRNQYMWLLNKVRMRIQKVDTYMRKAIPAETKLDVTLRFLASSESYTSLQ